MDVVFWSLINIMLRWSLVEGVVGLSERERIIHLYWYHCSVVIVFRVTSCWKCPWVEDKMQLTSVVLSGRDSLKRKFFLLDGCLLLRILLVMFLISDASSCIMCFCICRPIASLSSFYAFVIKCSKIMSLYFAVPFFFLSIRILQLENPPPQKKVFNDDLILGFWVNSGNKNGTLYTKS